MKEFKMSIEEIEKAALSLTSKEKAILSFKLIESIDSDSDEEVDKIWLDEIEKRYRQILEKNVKTKNADTVIAEAKAKYK